MSKELGFLFKKMAIYERKVDKFKLFKEEDPEEAEPPCHSTRLSRKSRIVRKIRNFFRPSSGSVETVESDNHDDSDEDEVILEKRICKKERYEI